MSPTDDQPGSGGSVVTPRNLAIGVLVIALVVLGIVLLTRNGDDKDSASTASGSSSTPSSSPASTQDPSSSSSPSTGSSSSASPKGGSASGTPAPVLSVGKPVRAAFTQAARPAPSLLVDITKVEKVEAKAEIPGEVSGPALRITVRVRNTSKKSVPIKTALTNLYYGPDRTPATYMTKPGSKSFPESVPAGGSATGVVLYTVPPKYRGNVVLEVIIDAQMRRIEFAGNCTSRC